RLIRSAGSAAPFLPGMRACRPRSLGGEDAKLPAPTRPVVARRGGRAGRASRVAPLKAGAAAAFQRDAGTTRLVCNTAAGGVRFGGLAAPRLRFSPELRGWSAKPSPAGCGLAD